MKFIVLSLKPESTSFDKLIQIESRFIHIERELNERIINSQEKDLIFIQIRNAPLL